MIKMWNFAVIFIACVACFSAKGEALAANRDEEIVRRLDDSASVEDRMLGFDLASGVDTPAVNEKLVLLLDSKAGGANIEDTILLPSWLGAMAILGRRFPDSGVTKHVYSYSQSDAQAFKAWWSSRAKGDAVLDVTPQAGQGDSSGEAMVHSPAEAINDYAKSHSSSSLNNRLGTDRQGVDYSEGDGDGRFRWLLFPLASLSLLMVGFFWYRAKQRSNGN